MSTRHKLSAYLVVALLFSLNVIAGEIPKEPILRIETGMHTAPINSIGIDAENLYLVTGSMDKTVRLWSLSTGRLINIIRPPIGEGDEGKIYAVAISPDGKTIACGGWTEDEGDSYSIYLFGAGGNSIGSTTILEDSYSIYLFDRETGRLIKRIKGLPNVIYHLAYSGDGRFLVATFGSNGIRIYRTNDYSLTAQDRDYNDDCYSTDFDAQGRLVTTCTGGFVRLYDNDFKLIAKKKFKEKPHYVKFSPDGTKIAVGFSNSLKVDVLSGKDLSWLYSPDTSGVYRGSFSSVSWSIDGNLLYAGGGVIKLIEGSWIFIIRKWQDAGRGNYQDLPAAENTLFHILPLRYGGIVYGSGEPSFGVFDASDKRVVYKRHCQVDYRHILNKFLISYDGDTVQFWYKDDNSLAQFSIHKRILHLGTQSFDQTTLSPPITQDTDLMITDWEDTHAPKLNGKPLKIEDYEFSRSLAILPDRSGFLLGTGWYLRLFDKAGNELWKMAIPGIAWGVNISGNGKVAICALGDGSIRWYRIRDGEELLTLFPHNDRKRWIIWTPSGYYDCSIGGEEIIGWHINNGLDREADFFPISAFRSTYYRPDVVAWVLDLYDESAAIRLANEEAKKKEEKIVLEKLIPPVVSIISPLDYTEISNNEITIRYIIRAPSAEPIIGVKILIDGIEIVKERRIMPGKEGGEVYQINVSVPSRNCELSIIAENKYSASVPATIRLIWKGIPTRDILKPTLYILAIGISNYEDKTIGLNYPAKDAYDFTKTMQEQKGLLYKDVVVKLLTNESAKRKEVLKGLDWITRQVTNQDVAMIFIAGHGDNDQYGEYYYLPQDVEKDNLKGTGVLWYEIDRTLKNLAGKRILFLDTCNAGNVMGKLVTMKRALPDVNKIVNELSSAENGVIVFAASSANQYSLEDVNWSNGAFTKALVEGIKGKADIFNTGQITITTLEAYICNRVKEMTDGKQTPNVGKPEIIPDFPIAVVK